MPNSESGAHTLRMIADALGIGVDAFFATEDAYGARGPERAGDAPLDRRLLRAFDALGTDERRLHAVRMVEVLAAGARMRLREASARHASGAATVAATEPERIIHASPNGDRWSLMRDPGSGHGFVRHVGNPASGGHVTDIALSAFLAADRGGPEHQALRRLMGDIAEE